MTIVSHQSPEVLHHPGGERPTYSDSVCVFTGADVERDKDAFRLYGGFLLLRGEYVKQMGWMKDREAPDDSDEYDLSSETHYVVKTDEKGEIQAGFRLKPISEGYLSESLSMHMWDGPIERESAKTLSALAEHEKQLRLLETGKTWDLTRLVTRGSTENYPGGLRQRIQEAKDLIRLFGAGVAVSGTDAFWLYTTTETVYDFLRHQQLAPHELVRDIITPGDPEESRLCYQDVHESVLSMYELNPRGYELLNDGYCKANGSTLIIGGNG